MLAGRADANPGDDANPIPPRHPSKLVVGCVVSGTSEGLRDGFLE
jgi:hypothetical protein